ncbi:hypothetical protein ABBQ32_004480 [Trebouxia sp. C0010 RCD-2024]
MEELPHGEKLQQLLKQIQQEAGGKQGTLIPKGGQEVTPQAGFVVKTTDQDKRKVFVNICGSDKVPMAGGWTDGKMPDEAKQFLQSAVVPSDASKPEVESCRFPLSLGEAKLETDKQGELCTVYDVVYNDQALMQAKAFRHLKLFLISFALAWIQQQKKITLDAKYKLPKMHYKGERVTSQIMRVDKQLVEDMGDVMEDPEFPLMTKRRHVTVPRAPKEITKVRDDTAQAARLDTSQQAGEAELVAAVEYIGRPVEHVVVTVDCPQTAASPGFTADVSGDHLYINMPGCKQLDVHLHFAVFAENATAQLLKDNKQLFIKLPYMPCRTYLDQLRTAKQQEGLLDLSFDNYLELEP